MPKKVLIVEDNELNMKLFHDLLEAQGYETLETREGLSLLINNANRFECRHVYASMEAALEGIGTNPPRVALVDIGLPGMSGIDGVRILR